MADGPRKGTKAPQGAKGVDVDALAKRALSIVASRPVETSHPVDARWVDRLDHAARRGGREDCIAVAAEMRADGIPNEDIADYYVPALARHMGDRWCEDSMSFAEVTIGVSRLQSLLRELGPEWRSDRNAPPNAQAALVVVATDNFHTLGAMVLTGQLRRMGLSVRLALGADAESISQTLEKTDYGAVLISAYKGESLERLRRLVDAVRDAGEPSPPVVIGGAILSGDENADEMRRKTGCDLVTNDLSEALDLCNLRTHAPAAAGLLHPPGT